MSRRKVDVTYITNPSKRKATFKKRKNGLIKKVHELSVLCRIKAAAIIYTPDNPQPEIWPCQKEVKSVLSEFKAVPEVERSENMVDLEICTQKMIIKAKEKLEKVRNENKKKEMSLHMSQYFFNNSGNYFDNANIIDQNGISHFTTQNSQKTKRKYTTRTAQKETLILENEREIMTQGEQAFMKHVRGSKTNVVAMENLNPSVEINNNSGNDKLSKLEDVFLKWLA